MINRERKRKVKINREIRTEESDEYFRKILGGLECRIKLELRSQGREKMIGEEKEEEKKEEKKEENISREEMESDKETKEKVSRGEDKLQNEIWL